MAKTIKEEIQRGKVLIGGYAQTQSPELVEIMGYTGFDFVILDTEHTAHSYEAVIHQLRAAQVVGISPIVRPSSKDPSFISRALDMGAEGVFVPVVETAEHAKQIVKAAKYYPLGERGICIAVKPGKYGASFGPKYFEETNMATWVAVLVETEKGAQNIKEIVNVKGIDLIFIGPTDLSQSLGVPGHITHPKVEKHIDQIVSAVKEHNMPLGIHIYNLTDSKELEHRIEQGFQFLTVFQDTALFYQACVQMRRACDVIEDKNRH